MGWGFLMKGNEGTDGRELAYMHTSLRVWGFGLSGLLVYERSSFWFLGLHGEDRFVMRCIVELMGWRGWVPGWAFLLLSLQGFGSLSYNPL